MIAFVESLSVSNMQKKPLPVEVHRRRELVGVSAAVGVQGQVVWLRTGWYRQVVSIVRAARLVDTPCQDAIECGQDVSGM